MILSYTNKQNDMMKKVVILGVWMMATTFLVAQSHSNGAHSARVKQADKMKTELSLDESQYASIMSIHEKYIDKYRLLRHDSSMVRDEKFAQHRALRSEQEKEIDAVLTTEQKNKWEMYKADRREKSKARMSEKKKAHQARMKTSLSLTDKQASELDVAGKTFRTKMQELHKESGISDELRVEKMKTIKASHEATVRAILSDDQFKKWTELKTPRNHGEMRKRKKTWK